MPDQLGFHSDGGAENQNELFTSVLLQTNHSESSTSSMVDHTSSLRATIAWLRSKLAAETERAKRAEARADELERQLETLRATEIQLVAAKGGDPRTVRGEILESNYQQTTLGRSSLASLSVNIPNKRRHDEDDDEDDDMRTVATLWREQAGSALNIEGDETAGRRRISGRQKIINKAARALDRATSYANPLAESLGLGPCLVDHGAAISRCRPIAYFEIHARSGKAKDKRNRTAMLYHVTWCAARNQPPPIGLEFSHLCHNSNCIEAKHGHWETSAANRRRNGCKGGKGCEHSPACIPAI